MYQTLLPLLLAITLFLNQLGIVIPADIDSRRVIAFSEMVYQRPDGDQIFQAFDGLTARALAAQSSDELLALYEESRVIYENFNGQFDLARLARYLDTSSAAAEEEFRFISDLEVDVSNALANVWCTLLENPHAAGLEAALGTVLVDNMKVMVLLSDPSVASYKKERAQLVIDYNQALSTLSLEKDGVVHTPDQIHANSYDEYVSIYYEIYEANAEQFATILSRLIELDKLTASTLGFDSPADMYYASYARDYSPEEAMDICGYVREYITPLYSDVMEYYYYGGSEANQKKFLNEFPKALAAVDADMVNVWRVMEQYGLYDFDTRTEKQNGIAFCTTLESYDAAFVFTNWEDDFGSASTIIHEFGHFYNTYTHAREDTVFNLDIAEFHSQGLEFLLHSRYDDMVSDPMDINELSALQGTYDTFLHQSLLEEMTQTLYTMDSFTAEDVAQLYSGLCGEYGYENTGSGAQWYRITHIFDNPFYTISYTTSAAAAMQLWELSEEDWDDAVAAYMEVTGGDQNRSFGETMTDAGLRQATEEALYKDLAALYKKAFS